MRRLGWGGEGREKRKGEEEGEDGGEGGMLGASERGKMGGKGWEIELKLNGVVMTQRERKKGSGKDREEG